MGSPILLETRFRKRPASRLTLLRPWGFGLLLISAVFLAFSPPIAQDQRYHLFADGRELFGVPNFLDVVSNAIFAVVGIMGLRRRRDLVAHVLFSGALLTCFGSSYYHVAPNDARLVWDRLPMTLVFMSVMAWVIAAATGTRCSSRMLVSLLIAGIASVWWWHATGDLRPYFMVQYGGMLVLFASILLVKSTRGLWPVLLFYSLAKLVETYDRAIYAFAPISGHTCKHLLAGVAVYFILRWHSRDCGTAPGCGEVPRELESIGFQNFVRVPERLLGRS